MKSRRWDVSLAARLLLGSFGSQPGKQVRGDITQALPKHREIVFVESELVGLWTPVEDVIEAAGPESSLQGCAHSGTAFETNVHSSASMPWISRMPPRDV